MEQTGSHASFAVDRDKAYDRRMNDQGGQLPAMTKQQQASLDWVLNLLDQIAAEDKRNVFQDPVDAKMYPTYHQVIIEPMCFSVMKGKLARQQYRTLRSFRHDLDLIFANARTFNAASTPIHKLATSMHRTLGRLMSSKEMDCRRHLYALHPDGAAAAAEEENSSMEIDEGFDKTCCQRLLLTPPSEALTGMQQQQQQMLASGQKQPRKRAKPTPETLSHSHSVWDLDNQQPTPGDVGLLFQAVPATSFEDFQRHQQHAVAYYPYAAAQQLHTRPLQQQQCAQKQEGTCQGSALQSNLSQSSKQQPQTAGQEVSLQQRPAPSSSPAQESAVSRCQWLHTRMLELQNLVNLLSAPGSTVNGWIASMQQRPTAAATAVAAAAAAAGGGSDEAAAVARVKPPVGTSARQQVPVLQVQQAGCLLSQHVKAVPLGSIQQSPFLAGQQAEPKQGMQPNAADASDPTHAPSASSIVKSVFAAPHHTSDAALMCSSLDLVEKQLVSAKLALGKAFGLDISWAPTGVRLGQYAAARLQASEGAAAAAAQGHKRSAAAAGLMRMPSMPAGGNRSLQRESSMMGSQKKRRLERSSLGAVGALSIDDDAVMSPSASRQMVERPSVSIHIPAVRELPPAERAARIAAATVWREAVAAQGVRLALADPPSEVRQILMAAAEAEGSSSEDTSDSAFDRMHAPLLEEEQVRLNPQGGGRKRNKNKLQQQNSKFDGAPYKQLQRETSTAAAAGAAASHVTEEPVSPPSSRQRAQKASGAAGLDHGTFLPTTSVLPVSVTSAVSSPCGTSQAAAAALAGASHGTVTSAAAVAAVEAAVPALAANSEQQATSVGPAAALRKLAAPQAPLPVAEAGKSVQGFSAGDGRQGKLKQTAMSNGVASLATAAAHDATPLDKAAGAGRVAKVAAAAGTAAAAAATTMTRSSSGGLPSHSLHNRHTQNGPVTAAGGSSRSGGVTRRVSAGVSPQAVRSVGGLAVPDKGGPTQASAGKQQNAAAGVTEVKPPLVAANKDNLNNPSRRRSAPEATGDTLVVPSAVATAGGTGRSRGRGASPQPRSSSRSPRSLTAAAGTPVPSMVQASKSVAAGTRQGRAAAAAANVRASRSKSKGTGAGALPENTSTAASAAAAAAAALKNGRGRGK